MISRVSHLFIIAAVICLVTATAWAATPQCNGTASAYGAYDDQQLVYLSLNGRNNEFEVTGSTITSSAQGRLYAKESGVTVDHVAVASRFHIFAGLNAVKILDLVTKIWSSVDVANCQPVGVVQHGDDMIVGYCELDTTRLPLCVQYFKLYERNGIWTDTSRPGQCSHSLSTNNLTNSVILQYLSQYGFATKLYFAEEGTNRLHEVDLGQQQTAYYDVPDHQGNVMKISRIIVASDETFAGLRLELVADNSPGVVYHRIFSSIEQRFLEDFYQTETVAFDWYDLSRLVSFSTNHKTMNIIPKNGSGILQYTLTSILDNPIRCENMAGPLTHHLVCLAGNGLRPILINVLHGTSQAIPIGDSPVVDLGALNENLIYLLNTQRVLSLFILDNSTALHAGDHTIRHSTSLRLFNVNSSLSCFDHESTGNRNNTTTNTSTITYVIIFLLCVITGVIATAILVTGRFIWLEKLRNKKLAPEKLQFNTTPSSSTISEIPETVHTPAEGSINDGERTTGGDGIPETPPEQATSGTGVILAPPPFDTIVQLDYPPHRIGIRPPTCTPNPSQFVEADSMVSAVSCTSTNKDSLTLVTSNGKQRYTLSMKK